MAVDDADANVEPCETVCHIKNQDCKKRKPNAVEATPAKKDPKEDIISVLMRIMNAANSNNSCPPTAGSVSAVGGTGNSANTPANTSPAKPAQTELEHKLSISDIMENLRGPFLSLLQKKLHQSAKTCEDCPTPTACAAKGCCKKPKYPASDKLPEKCDSATRNSAKVIPILSDSTLTDGILGDGILGDAQTKNAETKINVEILDAQEQDLQDTRRKHNEVMQELSERVEPIANYTPEPNQEFPTRA